MLFPYGYWKNGFPAKTCVDAMFSCKNVTSLFFFFFLSPTCVRFDCLCMAMIVCSFLHSEHGSICVGCTRMLVCFLLIAFRLVNVCKCSFKKWCLCGSWGNSFHRCYFKQHDGHRSVCSLWEKEFLPQSMWNSKNNKSMGAFLFVNQKKE